MKVTVLALFVVALAGSGALAAKETVSPIGKVLQLIGDLQAKIIREGEVVQKVYNEFAEQCEDRSKDLHNAIKTGKAEASELKAVIADLDAKIEGLENKIGELASSISESEGELKEATAIRTKEAADFSAEEKDLVETIDMLGRAIGILQREADKGASFVQLQGVQTVEQALAAMVSASAIRTADASKLTALVQSASQSDSDSDDDDAGAPDAAAYEGKSGTIVETLQNLLDKAESQVASARKEESTANHNFEMQKQALEDQTKYGNADLDKAKKGLASSGEKKATAEGDLTVTLKDLKEDIKALEVLHHACMDKASDFEEETTSRGEELNALAQAKKIVQDATGGAEKQTYDLNQVSFVQVKMKMKSDGPSGARALHIVRRLAFAQRSSALAQLATRMETAVRFGGKNSDDPFAKVRGLIADMLNKLQAEAESDATEKAYCDKQMGETGAKKDEKEDESEVISTKINQMTSKSARLSGEVGRLAKEIGDIVGAQGELDALRQQEKAIFAEQKPEMEQGLEGIKLALKVLREYYAQDSDSGSAGGAGASIIGLLEVAESDFSKGLAQMESAEERSQAEYDKETKENGIEKATKDQDVKYKKQEIAGLEKATADARSDFDGVKDELDAVLDYFAEVKKRCVAKAEPYEERKKRREAELAGLKDALQVLEGEGSSLLQMSTSHHRTLRGGRH